MIDDIIKGAVEALIVCVVFAAVVYGGAYAIDKLAESRREAMKRPLIMIDITCNNGVCAANKCTGSLEDVYDCLDSLDE